MVEVGERVWLAHARLGAVIDALWQRQYRVIGPMVRDDVIVLGEVRLLEDLPAGWVDEQDGGTYRLRRRGGPAVFAHTLGPHSWRRYLSPPRKLLWRATSAGGELVVEPSADDDGPFAFLGVRSCDLRAIEVQDRVFAQGGHQEPGYVARRAAAFVVAVNCTEPGGTCFCTSMATGPRAGRGFDLALTEVLDGPAHFIIEVGSAAGAELLSDLADPSDVSGPADSVRAASAEEEEAAVALVESAAGRMGRSLPGGGLAELRDLLATTLEDPRWDEVAARCLACANCTLVCPTCFCSTVEDTTDVTGEHAERWSRWDSCFTAEFSYIHGGSVRTSTRSRYRQWLTHKLGTWHDQFGMSGCVGCGRCITWCPVGIDLTEEVAALRGLAGAARQP